MVPSLFSRKSLANILLAGMLLAVLPPLPLLEVGKAEAANSFTFDEEWKIRDFVNGLTEPDGVTPRFTRIPDGNSGKDGAIRFDDVSAKKVCELKGFNRVFSKTRGFYSSPGDNSIAYYEPSIDDFVIIFPAYLYVPPYPPNEFFDQLTCVDPIPQPPAPTNISTCVSIDAPSTVGVNQTFNATIVMKNTGTNTWTQAANYNLGSTNPMDNRTWGFHRMGVSGSVSTNQNATFNFVASAPQNPGTYAFDWQMVQDGVNGAWFGGVCQKTITVVAPQQITGCIDITKTAFGPTGNQFSNVPKFEFKVDGQSVGKPDSSGHLKVSNLSLGTHTVTEAIPYAWMQPTVSPANGTVTVTPGNACATVSFVNRQNTPPAPVTPLPTVCGDVTMKVDFAADNVPARVTFGNGQAYASGSPFKVSQVGGSITDSSWFTNIPTLTARRQNGYVELFARTGPAVPDGPGTRQSGTITIQGGTITSVLPNLIGQAPGDPDPFSGLDSFDNDFVQITSPTTAIFSTWYSTGGDGFTINYTPDAVNCSPAAQGADLSITKFAPSSVTRGSTLTYTLLVRNDGPALATNVTAADIIPAGLTFNASQSDVNCVQNGASILCNNTAIAPNQFRTFQVAFTTSQTLTCNTQIENRSSVSSSQTDPNPGNNQSNATSTTISCPVPPQCSDGIDNDGDGAIDSNDFSCSGPTDNDETLPRAACQDFVDNDNDGLTDFPQDPGCTSNQDNDEFNALPTADLSITKSARPASVTRGGTVTYTLTVNNAGPATATNIVAADVIPAGLTFLPSQSDVNCIQNGASVLCNNTSLAAGQSRSFQIAFTASQTLLCNSQIQNRASVSSSQTDPNSANNQSNTTSVTVSCPVPPQCRDGLDNDNDGATDFPADFSCATADDNNERFPMAACQNGLDDDGDGLVDFPSDPGCISNQDNNEFNAPTNADLSITKFALASSVTRGGTIGYILTVSNAGPAAATNVTASDVIPAGLTFSAAQSDVNCIQNGASVLCNNTSLAAGQIRSFQIAFTVSQTLACNSEILNSASVSSSQTDLNPGNNQSNATSTTVSCPVTPLCSDGIDNDSDGATDFPADFSCSSPTDTDETLPRAACQDFVDNDGDGLTDFPQDPGCTSNQDNDEFNAALGADLSITKSGNLSSVTRGGTVTYTLTVSNAGPATATNVVAADVIPAGLTFVPAQSDVNCIQNGASVLCNNTNLVSGQSRAFTIVFTVSQGATCNSSIVNTASVSSSQTDPNSANNQSNQISTLVTCPVPPQCSDSIDNDGDGATDFPNDFSCSSATDNDETLPRAACQDSVDNDSDGLVDFPQDPGCLSNQDNDEFNAPTTADLSITKSGGSSVIVGSQVTYTLTATNAGPATATNVLVADLIPTGLTFVSAPGCVLNAGGTSVLCNNFSLASGASQSFTVTFAVPSTAICPGAFTNTATVSASTTDPNAVNNSSTVTTVTSCQTFQCSDAIDNDGDGATDFPNDFSCSSPTDNDETNPKAACQDGVDNDGDNLVDFPLDPGCTSRQDNDESNAAPGADLSITKSGGPSSVTRGGTVTYTLTVSNAGPATATNVVAADVIPAGLTFNSAQSDVNCIQNGASILCTASSLASGQSRAFTIVFTVSQTQACNSSIVNTASVSGSQTDPNSGNNQSNQISTLVTCPVTPQCSDNIDNDADGATDFPADFSCSSPTDDDETNPKAACQDGVDNDGDGMVDFPLDPGCSSKQDNDEFNAPVAVVADVSLTKSAPSTISLGGTLLYTITVTNTGPNTATNVLVKDPIPSALGSAAFLPAQSGGCSLSASGSEIQCGGSTLTLIPGGRRTFTIGYSVPTTTNTCSATIANQASVSATETDPQTGNNVSSPVATTVVCLPADVSVTKGGPSTVPLGGTILYMVTVSNTGPGIATDVLLTDAIPAALTSASFLPAQSPGCRLSNTATAVECGGSTLTLIPGGRRTFTIAFTAPTSTNACAASPVVNQVQAAAFQVDPNMSNNTSEAVATTVVCASADVSLTKSAPSTINLGGTLLYTITVTNTGPNTATNVLVKDPIPSALGSANFLPAQSGGCALNTAGTEVQCGGSTLTLIPGGRRTFTIAFSIPSATTTCNATISNQSSVSASETDPQMSNNTSAPTATTVTCQ